MRPLMLKTAAIAALATLGGPALAQAPPTHHGILGHLFHHPAQQSPVGHRPMPGGAQQPDRFGMTSPITGGVVGNRNSHVYHLPGDKGALPSAKNSVYFHSAAEAEAAGYHRAGSGVPRIGQPRQHVGHPLPGTR